jgi:hypothetical protein
MATYWVFAAAWRRPGDWGTKILAACIVQAVIIKRPG